MTLVQKELFAMENVVTDAFTGIAKFHNVIIKNMKYGKEAARSAMLLGVKVTPSIIEEPISDSINHDAEYLTLYSIDRTGGMEVVEERVNILAGSHRNITQLYYPQVDEIVEYLEDKGFTFGLVDTKEEISALYKALGMEVIDDS